LEVLQHFAPPVVRELVAAGETAAWATYGAGMQVIALAEVTRLNKLTVTELKGLQTIHCVSVRHTVQRYETKIKLAELTGRGLSELVKPTQSKSCAA
jgi:hypothetical protein